MENKIANIEANYTTTLHWNMEDVAKSEGFKVEDVKRVEVGKWATLYIYLKNGKSIDVEASLDNDNTDYKWADNLAYFSKDWELLEKL